MNNEDIKYEKQQEYLQDTLITEQDIWIEENKKDLMQDYCEENDDFNDYCRSEYYKAN